MNLKSRMFADLNHKANKFEGLGQIAIEYARKEEERALKLKLLKD